MGRLSGLREEKREGDALSLRYEDRDLVCWTADIRYIGRMVGRSSVISTGIPVVPSSSFTAARHDVRELGRQETSSGVLLRRIRVGPVPAHNQQEVGLYSATAVVSPQVGVIGYGAAMSIRPRAETQRDEKVKNRFRGDPPVFATGDSPSSYVGLSC